MGHSKASPINCTPTFHDILTFNLRDCTGVKTKASYGVAGTSHPFYKFSMLLFVLFYCWKMNKNCVSPVSHKTRESVVFGTGKVGQCVGCSCHCFHLYPSTE